MFSKKQKVFLQKNDCRSPLIFFCFFVVLSEKIHNHANICFSEKKERFLRRRCVGHDCRMERVLTSVWNSFQAFIDFTHACKNKQTANRRLFLSEEMIEKYTDKTQVRGRDRKQNGETQLSDRFLENGRRKSRKRRRSMCRYKREN